MFDEESFKKAFDMDDEDFFQFKNGIQKLLDYEEDKNICECSCCNCYDCSECFHDCGSCDCCE